MNKQALPIIQTAITTADQISTRAHHATTRTTALRSKLAAVQHIGRILEQEKPPSLPGSAGAEI